LLWSLSGIFSAIAIAISIAVEMYINYLIIVAGVIWAGLFVLFFRTRDN
jgi:hypothetical protein